VSKCKPLVPGSAPPPALAPAARAALSARLGKVVQVDPMKPILKPPGTKHFEPKCDKVLSTFGFDFNDPMKPILKPPGTKHLKLKCDIVL
jgi:hypothetical protein